MNGERALRTSQGHSANSGVTSDYLPQVPRPGWVVHGSTLDNARSICTHGVNRMERFHIHLGRLVNNRPTGIRPGSEVAVVIGGEQCVKDGMRFFQPANGVRSAEGFEGRIPRTYITTVYVLSTGRTLYTRQDGWGEEVEESDQE